MVFQGVSKWLLLAIQGIFGVLSGAPRSLREFHGVSAVECPRNSLKRPRYFDEFLGHSTTLFEAFHRDLKELSDFSRAFQAVEGVSWSFRSLFWNSVVSGSFRAIQRDFREVTGGIRAVKGRLSAFLGFPQDLREFSVLFQGL